MTDSLVDRLIRYILNHHPITLDRLTKVATSKGFTELEVLMALEQVHADKRISVTNLKDGVTYRPAVSKAPREQTHLKGARENYPKPDPWCLDENGNMIDPFPEVDFSWMFLRTREERDAYKAQAKGMPVHMYNKSNGRRAKSTT